MENEKNTKELSTFDRIFEGGKPNMSVYGIISEFNPFHNGHKHLFERARASGADAIVCVMSGNSVQRGEIALTDKYKRAEMALTQGADLVLELPYPYSSASAEHFAAAGVSIASEFADTLFFGSECGDADLLREAARICMSEEFIDEYKNTLASGAGTASAYFELLERKTGRKYLSNDILGIEYIKAALRLNSDVAFATTPRVGGAYASAEIEDGDLQSASAIRALVARGDIEKASDYMPKECFEILRTAILEGKTTDTAKLGAPIKLFFRMSAPEDICNFAECDMGIASRICAGAKECADDDIMAHLRTKRYTDARLRRAMLFALTGVLRDDVKAAPQYTNLLAANACGRELLAKKRKREGLAVLAKAADVPNTSEAKRQAELSARLDSVFALALEKEISATDMLRISPIIH